MKSIIPPLSLLLCLRLSSALSPLSTVSGHVQDVLSDTVTSQAKDFSKVISASPLLSFHRSLVSVPSVSNYELAVAELLVDYLEASNFSVVTQEVPQPASSNANQKRLNVIAFPKPSAFGDDDSSTSHPSPKVLLSSHIDTVPPFIPYTLSLRNSSSRSGSFARRDILISGRGTVDAKACVATQTHALLSLLRSSRIPASAAALVFVVGEEASGSGMKVFSASALHASLNYSSVIFGEPTELALATGHKGILGATLNATGRAVHSGYPWLGRSAVSTLLPALVALDNLGQIPEADGGLARSDKYGNSTVNIGLVRGGVAANVVAESAHADVLIRLAGGTSASAREAVLAAVGRSGSDSDSIKIEFTNGYSPVDMDGGVEGFKEITVNYGTDVPNLEVRPGTKRYLYGPGSILVAHGRDEALTVGDLEDAVEGYKKLVLHALGL